VPRTRVTAHVSVVLISLSTPKAFRPIYFVAAALFTFYTRFDGQPFVTERSENRLWIELGPRVRLFLYFFMYASVVNTYICIYRCRQTTSDGERVLFGQLYTRVSITAIKMYSFERVSVDSARLSESLSGTFYFDIAARIFIRAYFTASKGTGGGEKQTFSDLYPREFGVFVLSPRRSDFINSVRNLVARTGISASEITRRVRTETRLPGRTRDGKIRRCSGALRAINNLVNEV